MPSFGILVFATIVALLAQSGQVVASEDNPWRMDDPDQGKQSQYDLNSKEGIGSSFQTWKGQSSPTPSKRSDRDQPGETIVPKSTPGPGWPDARGRTGQWGAWQTAPGKGSRDEIFGFAGRQPQGAGKLGDASRFGAFPPTNRYFGKARSDAASSSSRARIRHGGRSYGAFPPLYDRANNVRRRQKRMEQGGRFGTGLQYAFPNVPPPPVPDPVPERGYAFPYARNALPLNIAPYSRGGLGPYFQNPGLYGFMPPGLLW